MDSNKIINNLDDLIAQGNSINDIVSMLDDIRIVANYDRLIQKGATNIDLTKIRDTASPIVVFNNYSTFKNANVPVDIIKIAYGLLDDGFAMSTYDVDKWLGLGADPQTMANKYIDAGGFELDVIDALLNAGARVNAEGVINNLSNDTEYLLDDFYAEDAVPMLKQIGASSDSIQKLLKHVSDLNADDEIATYGGPYPHKLDLEEEGNQTTKIFFKPQIQIITPKGGREMPVDWAGRILPGQTLEEGIASELKEVYGYAGRFDWRHPYFLEWAKDNQGINVQQYGIYLTLYPTDGDKLPQ